MRKKYSGLIVFLSYGLVLTGLSSVSMCVVNFEYDNMFEKVLTCAFLFVLLLYVVISAYRDIEEYSEQKRNEKIELKYQRGNYIDKFFCENNIMSYSDRETFIKAAVDNMITEIENGEKKY